MSLPIYELKINENINDDSEVSFISLVDAPAIKKDFLAFKDEFVEPRAEESENDFINRCVKYVMDEGTDHEQAMAICYSKWENKFAETYNDYPDAAVENAKTALRWAEKNGWGTCGEATGKRRASMLANRENLSRETIARMASFERHRKNSDRPLGEGCGRLMWLAWGGDAGVEWAQRKLKQIDKEKMSEEKANMSFSITNEEQRIISGPIMLADQLIYRNNERFGEHYVKFSAETIKAIAIKFAKKKYHNNVNIMHNQGMAVDDVTMFESWLVDRDRGIKPMSEYAEVADGSWFGSFYVENEKVWNEEIKTGKLKGFSVEGLFDYQEPISAEEYALQKISKLLNELSE
jgi:hypothetical protein